MTLPQIPPFQVPAGIGAYSKGALKKSRLLDLYEKNREDFIDCAGVVYSVVLSIQPDAFSAPQTDGYSIFCDFFANCLLFAPTQLNMASIDASGDLVNVFGSAITDTCFPKVTIQDLYGHDGIKNSVGWHLCLDLIRLVAIDAFAAGIHLWTPGSVLAAKNRLSGLRTGRRQLYAVEGAGPYGRADGK